MTTIAQSDQGAVFGPFPVITTDTSTGLEFAAPFQAYTGPVSGLLSQYATPVTADSYNVTANTPDIFVLGGSGNDGLTVMNGNNILDGGTGSNFLTGTASGLDTFYLDDRATTGANTWSTLVNLHSGDATTVWGITQAGFTLTWLASQGAAGAMGLTGVWQANGRPEAGLTLAGFTPADLTNGRLSLSYGTTPLTGGVPGSTYLHISVT